MKRYETMSKEDILKFITDASERGDCSECVVDPICDRFGCINNAVKYLQQGIDMKPRIAVIDSIEKLEKAFKEYDSICASTLCDCCKYMRIDKCGTRYCFKNFLAEEIEVEKDACDS